MDSRSTQAVGRPERIRTEPDSALQDWLSAAAAAEAVAARMGAARLRVATKSVARHASPGPDMAVVEDHDLGDHLTVRLYRPRLVALPIVIYLHGGGYVVGDLDSHDRLARRIAAHADVTVIAVDYRRAPEYRAPAAIDDGVRAALWADAMCGLLGGDDQAGIGIAGDSAGGLLAAATALRLRDAARLGSSPPPAHLLLLTPHTDLTLTAASIVEKGHGWGLEQADMRWYVDQWTTRDQRVDPTVSPAYATLAGMPPTFVVTAEHDPLRDDGLWFAERIRSAGGICEHLHFDHLVHGFLNLDQVSPVCAQAGDETLRRYGQFLRHTGATGVAPV
ncbi:Acetyl esterase [Austwickia sp. TVS 96-490-7B]|uniref:alpha/beta hydrolase n=1 Tax=Austwickia sp. TVS 96-490-7B TaxID=2830843 RepID=UPI001C56ED8D|nr:alpha/beta hydrolase [Austwickia sp. TVS 96-490-7B]MBW3084419.1 Acetyl esterase [Austwickia sp. TVS 96-490-7B]